VVTNRVLGPLAYVTPPFTIVVNRGRKSGREYRSPVWAFRTKKGYVIPLTYRGSRTEWAMNVIAAGKAKLVSRQTTRDVIRPRIIHGDEGMRMLPAVVRPPLRLLRVNDFLLLDAAQ
jgi:deazaflavin-dependent oxidoreductase (nitroreductase family)